MKTGIFYAVGVGTEPLDLTLRAKQVLETAEVLVTPITRAGEPSAAARIAEQVVSFSGKEIIPLLFPMQKHLDYRERLRGELLQPVRDCLQAGKRVAMVTLGDVSIYSTAAYVQQVLEADGYATEVVAGISAFLPEQQRQSAACVNGRNPYWFCRAEQHRKPFNRHWSSSTHWC